MFSTGQGNAGNLQEHHKSARKGLLSTCLVYDSCLELKLASFSRIWNTREKLSGKLLHHFVRAINCFLRVWSEAVPGVVLIPSWVSVLHPSEPEVGKNDFRFRKGRQEVDCRRGVRIFLCRGQIYMWQWQKHLDDVWTPIINKWGSLIIFVPMNISYASMTQIVSVCIVKLSLFSTYVLLKPLKISAEVTTSVSNKGQGSRFVHQNSFRGISLEL